MKKVYSISLAIVSVFLMISCASDGQKQKTAEESTQQQDVVRDQAEEPATRSEATPESTGSKALIKTDYGNMTVLLYDETPQHRDNFIKLVEDGFYDGTLFHRVIPDFMIQGGDPDSKEATPDQPLGRGGPEYTIEAEFHPDYIHKKGALAAARQG
ncbi:MAG: peptidylprolyl isomerase, partial [Bacteroidota bacterium]